MSLKILRSSFVLSFLCLLTSSFVQAEENSDSAFNLTSKGLSYNPSDLFVHLGGRAQFDRSIFDDDETQLEEDTDFRRLRLKLTFGEKGLWQGRYSYDFESEATQDAYIDFSLSENINLTIGQFKTKSSLASRTSSKWLSFAERAPLHSRVLNERGVRTRHGFKLR